MVLLNRRQNLQKKTKKLPPWLFPRRLYEAFQKEKLLSNGPQTIIQKAGGHPRKWPLRHLYESFKLPPAEYQESNTFIKYLFRASQNSESICYTTLYDQSKRYIKWVSEHRLYRRKTYVLYRRTINQINGVEKTIFVSVAAICFKKITQKRACAEEVWFQHIYISKEKNPAFDIRLVPGV